MTTKLIQKHLLKGTREFEIVGEQVNMRIKAPLQQEETLSVMLTVLNPEPVITQSELSFVSRVNGEPLISMFLGKPNAKEFNEFVGLVKERAQEEFSAFSGTISVTKGGGPGGNVSDEPPEFEVPDDQAFKTVKRKVRVAEVASAIAMLETHLDADQIKPLLDALRVLQDDSDNQANLVAVATAFHGMGFNQGAILTYAPYIGVMLSDDPFGH